MIHPICAMEDGTEINVELINSTASRAIAKQPQLIGLLKEALLGKKLSGTEVRLEHDMGRGIGYDFIVDTPNEDAVFYAQVLGDDIYTRFVKMSKPVATNYLSVVMRRSADGSAYELQNIRIGRLAPLRPELSEIAESKNFWMNHAFLYTDQVLQPRTVTKTCPY